LPKYATEHSVAVDIQANITAEWLELLPNHVIRNIEDLSFVLNPLEHWLIPTGLFVEIPIGYEAQIRPRSGLSLKQGLAVLNSPGTIDSDYRGEVGVILANISDLSSAEDSFVTIKHGDRIAQMIVKQVEKMEFEEVTELSVTDRGEGGFGSTGK
jgi:dUTP pyrophosphatase